MKTIENPIFPIVYKVSEDKFEILNDFIPERKNQIWGYEFLPNMIIFLKTDDASIKSNKWKHHRAFARKMTLYGKAGDLPSWEFLSDYCTKEIREKMRAMDSWIEDNILDGGDIYQRESWCREHYRGNRSILIKDEAYSFCIRSGNHYRGCKKPKESRRPIVSFI